MTQIDQSRDAPICLRPPPPRHVYSSPEMGNFVSNFFQRYTARPPIAFVKLDLTLFLRVLRSKLGRESKIAWWWWWNIWDWAKTVMVTLVSVFFLYFFSYIFFLIHLYTYIFFLINLYTFIFFPSFSYIFSFLICLFHIVFKISKHRLQFIETPLISKSICQRLVGTASNAHAQASRNASFE